MQRAWAAGKIMTVWRHPVHLQPYTVASVFVVARLHSKLNAVTVQVHVY